MNSTVAKIKHHVEVSDFKSLIPVTYFSFKTFHNFCHLQFDSHMADFKREKMPCGFFKLSNKPIVRHKVSISGDKHEGLKFDWTNPPENRSEIERSIWECIN